MVDKVNINLPMISIYGWSRVNDWPLIFNNLYINCSLLSMMTKSIEVFVASCLQSNKSRDGLKKIFSE